MSRQRPFRIGAAALFLGLLSTSCVHGRYSHRHRRPVETCYQDNEVARGLHLFSAFLHVAAALSD